MFVLNHWSVDKTEGITINSGIEFLEYELQTFNIQL